MSKKRIRSSSGNILNYFDFKCVCRTSTTSNIAIPEPDSAGVSVVLVESKNETSSGSATAVSLEEQSAAILTIQTTAHPNDIGVRKCRRIGHYINVTVPLTN